MSNLLDKASIILTPTAYNNGEALCVKPSDGSGDFDFSRNSAATRVNAQGLVENVQILSSNLVSNGDFSQEGSELVTNGSFATDSDWTKQTSWSISGGSANYDFLSDSKYIRQTLLNGGFVAGKTYKINFEITSGTAYINVSSNASGLISLNTYSVGSYSIYVTPSISASDLLFYGRNTSGTAFSITNISVKEVGQNWVFSSGAFITDIGARLTHTPTAGTVSSVGYSPLVLGNNYKMTYEITESISGGIKINSAVNPTMVGTVGVHTKYFKADSPSISISRTNSGGNDVTITNISIIEITTDTSLPRINYEGFSYQDALGSEEIVNGSFDTDSDWNKASGVTISDGKANAAFGSSGNILRQSLVTFDANKTYKYEFTISNYVSGNLKFASFIGAINESGNGTYVGYGKPNGTGVNNMILFGSFEGSIDNVSVKEYLGQEVVPDSGCGSWLWEPQSTNLITQSELFSDAYWTKNGVSVLGGFTSPSGDLSAFKLVENTSSVHVIYNPSNAFSSLTDASYSIFVKYSGRQWVRLFCEFGTTSYNSWFDILNGVTGTSSADISDIQDYGNGWFKITQTNSLDAANGRYRFYLADADNSTTYTGDGVSGVYIWGAQAENQSYATSYIPTEGSTVTRNQDVCTNGGSLASINSTEGVLYAEIAAFDDDSLGRYITISDGVLNSNAIRLLYHNSNAVYFQKIVNGVRTTNLATTSITKTDFNKIAIRYNSTDVSAFVNGVNISNNADTNIISPNTLNVLEFENVTESFFFGKTKCVAVWKEALTDEELTELTTI